MMMLKTQGKLLAQVLGKMMKVVPKATAARTVVLLRLVASLAGTLQLTIARAGVTLTTEIPAVVSSPGKAFVPPTALSDLVRASATIGATVELDHDDIAREMRIVAGPVDQTLGTLESDESTQGDGDDVDGLEVIRVPARDLKLALDRLAPVQATGADLGAPGETALDIDAEGRVTLVATDSVRMAMVGVKNIRIGGDVSVPKALNLRSTDLRLLSGLLNGDTSADEEVEVRLSARAWSASWGRCRMTAPYSEREFPKWRSIRPASYSNTIEVDSTEFGAILRLLGKVSDTKRGTVRFRWNGSEHASLTAGNRQAGTETEVALGLTWRSRTAPPGSELAMSAKLLEPLVKRLGPGPVLLSFTTASLPAMVRPADGVEQVEYLQMPINL